MSSQQTLLIVIGALLGSLLLIWLIVRLVYSYFEEKVKETSEMYNRIVRLNQQYNLIFHDNLRTENNHQRVCSSKREFDNVSLDMEFQLFLEGKLNFFDALLVEVAENEMNYKKYLVSYEKHHILTTRDEIKKYRISYNIYNSIEEKLYAKERIEPILGISGSVYVSYTSPQGRNSYHKERNYTFEQIKVLVPQVHHALEYRKTQEYLRKLERSKVTASLRYDVIRRDASTCKLCNASINDGIKLHVDHIIPVSKGGKIELSNLQTLCERCNFGKTNKL